MGWGLDRTQEPQVGVLPSFGSAEARVWSLKYRDVLLG